MVCRCGWDGEGSHPCHYNGYACRRPAQRRLIGYPTALAGTQMKVGAYETFACDECWAEHLERLKVHTQVLAIVDTFPEFARQPGADARQGGFDYDTATGAWVLVVDTIKRPFHADPSAEGIHVPGLAGLSGVKDIFKAIEAIYEAVVPENKRSVGYGV